MYKSNKPKGKNISDTLLKYGTIIKANSFDTERGCYTIRIIRFNNDLYFHKMLNGRVVEVLKLEKL